MQTLLLFIGLVALIYIGFYVRNDMKDAKAFWASVLWALLILSIYKSAVNNDDCDYVGTAGGGVSCIKN